MEWDLGLQGLGLLLLMSVVFGAAAQVVAARLTTSWVGLIAAAAYFVGGLLVSEWMFGWATAEDLQPNIDGLSFDETLFGGLIVGIVAVLATGLLMRSTHQRPVLR